MEDRPVKSESFQLRTDKEFGSFSWTFALLKYSLSDESRKVISDFDEGRVTDFSVYNQEELMDIAYQITSQFHEYRHFADMFGTMSGLQMVAGKFSQLKRFAETCYQLQADGQSWQFPLKTWSATTRPDYVKKFLKEEGAFQQMLEIAISPFVAVSRNGHIEDLLTDVDYRGASVKAATVRIYSVKDNVQTPRTILYPMGLETFLEGNAHAISMTLVEALFPGQTIPMTHSVLPVMSDGEEAAQMMPYMICDLIVSRFMKSKGHPRFERDAILGLIDRNLSNSVYEKETSPSVAKEVYLIRSFAKSFISILDGEDVRRLQQGFVSKPDYETWAYQAVLDGIERQEDIDTIPEEVTPLNSIKVTETYFARNYTMPLLKERLATQHDAFRTHSGFIKMFASRPHPVHVLNGRLDLQEMPARVQGAWMHLLMMSEILRQLLAGKETIRCPKAYCLVPGLEEQNLVQGDGHCSDYQRIGCGSFRRGQVGVFPKCVFEDTMKHCAFKR